MIRNLVIQITSRCNIKCKHCALMCGPQDHGLMSTELLQESISAAAKLKIPLVTATGGEPTLEKKLLLQFVRSCANYGLKWKIVTNGNWGRNLNEANKLTHQLGKFSPGGFCISVDQFHQEYISLQTIRHSIEVSLEHGIDVELKVCMVREKATWDILKEVSSWNVPFVLVPVVSLGRAKAIERKIMFEQQHIYACETVESPYIRCDGVVTLCCGATESLLDPGSALILGHASREGIESALRKHQRPYVEALQKIGPTHLAQWVQKKKKIFKSSKLVLRGMNFCEICAYISRSSFIVSTIENTPLKQLQEETAIPKEYDLYFLNEPLKLVESADYLTLSSRKNGKISNREMSPVYGILSFVSHGAYDFFLLNDIALRVVQDLSHSDGPQNFFSWLGSQSTPSLEQVKVRHVIARMKSAGALEPYK